MTINIKTGTPNVNLPKFDKVDVMTTHMDSKINNMIKEGLDLDGISKSINETISRFEIVINASDKIDPRFKYLYTHNRVGEKMISDIQFIKSLQKEYLEFSEYSTKRMIDLLRLRNKIIGKKVEVNIPESIT